MRKQDLDSLKQTIQKTIKEWTIKEWTVKDKESLKDYPRLHAYNQGLSNVKPGEETIDTESHHPDFEAMEKSLKRMGHTPNSAYDLGRKHSDHFEAVSHSKELPDNMPHQEKSLIYKSVEHFGAFPLEQ